MKEKNKFFNKLLYKLAENFLINLFKMNNKFLPLLALCFIVFSCKNEDKKTLVDSENSEATAIKRMHIQMDVIQTTANNYAVYYTEDNTINFTPEFVIWNEVKPSPNAQTLDFYFPESVHPTHVRFDLGNQPEREDIVLNKFRFSYGETALEVKGSEFFNYFQKNDSVSTEIDQANGSIKFLNKKGSKVTPFFYPNEALVLEIIKIMK
ncbi:hypothetical protein [Flavobacterium lacus]|uniref:Uncharacterized protein n=1 Tax=Flavobacterium lacus TaxID=1353778 RepID=A0A328X385_9FLAO|nr:hypothetical protein [Flavobacterium lacus]RAR49719.1 hypothetical protein B0I10_103140 [Flavobacterium lacus]